jgi:hypothetical protein
MRAQLTKHYKPFWRLALVAASVACSSSSDDASSDAGSPSPTSANDGTNSNASPGGGDSADGDHGQPSTPACTAHGFSRKAAEWTLPFSLGGSGSRANAPATQDHAVLDLDGDRHPDFFVYRDNERQTQDPLVGKNHWLMFKAQESGFAAAPVEWALPFPLTANGGNANAMATRAHAMVDINGDHLPDFLVFDDTERSERDPLVGKDHWLVFKNTGTGFSKTATPWDLPYPLGTNNALSTNAHVLFDITGDGKPDFVVLRDTERGTADPLVGKDHWLVFRNTGTGFSRTEEPWQLPYSLGGASSTANSLASNAHATIDLNGDAKADFVVYRDTERGERDPLVGKNHWLFYANTGSGFARTAEPWSLPYSLGGLDSSANALSSDAHVLTDFTGDKRPDFVVYKDSERPEEDVLVGKEHWLLFRNTGTGFERTPSSWTLPYSLGGRQSQSNAIASRAHLTLDMTGRGLVDFLVYSDTERSTADALVGKHHWLLFPSECEK